ncbi:Vacuolar protein sorting-associate Vta1 N-terminal [Penicillium longicatenatum]|uniref:Vacuolar protein sorting-associate Vta1 N-terminal n=1 Tax=Penicillium longicatenatum TaxID=1561947 RepID=UPI0025480482|nr:Vacuolar protein sorting-associate Vta1 N-terminal [Penicillium longicatenatum]KAJ5636818.1 Vacuolar protein sorting-associate Vta1 N-terminal [Penicillium longicatenatum]
MTSNIPASVRSADIGRFALRAAQLEKAKPVIAYWCNYHIVNQIIARGLHNSDDEAKLYTVDLMDKLEQFKNDNPENETVTDSVAANAYVEQFGVEVFDRAQAAMTANKVTKQTGDTFLAAATFLELCQIWGDMDPEIAGRIKFAKYHAIRITKAIKAGEDPNASNPAPKEEEEEETQVGSSDIQAFDESVAEQAAKPRQASVEEIPDEADRLGRHMALQSSLDESLHPSRTSSLPPSATATPPEIPSVPQNAPGSPPQKMDVDNQSSGLELPSTPGTIGTSASIPQLPDTPGSTNTNRAPSNAFQSFPPPSSPSVAGPDPASFYDASTASAHIPAPAAAPVGPPSFTPPVVPAPAASSQPSHSVDDNAVALAQKHARWAVSALTFDDVHTAIKELKSSLKYLGAE